MSIMTIDQIQKLSRQRWIVPLLAVMAARNGARFVELLHALPISRESLSRTLQCALEDDWIARNSGHGHPLRPEYILTDAGARVAVTCSQIAAAQSTLKIGPTLFSRWSLPLIKVVGEGEKRFSSIARALPASNPRALSQSLKGLTQHHVLSREIVSGYPPTSEYDLTARGHMLATVLV